MKNIFKSKQSVLIGIIILIVLLCVVFGIAGRNLREDKKRSNSKEHVEMIDNANQTNDESEETEMNNAETNDSESKTENGLKVIETPDDTIDSVDGSGSWNDKDTTTNDVNNDKNDTTTADNKSDENILVDDKVWGDVN